MKNGVFYGRHDMRIEDSPMPRLGERDGINRYCEHMTDYGTAVDGGFAGFCAVDARQVYKLGGHTSFEQGAMTEPVAYCLHGMDMCNVRPGSIVVVFGAGMIGLLMMQLAKLAGPQGRFTRARGGQAESRRATGCRPHYRLDPRGRPRPPGRGRHRYVDVVIECVGKPVTIEQAIGITGHKATVMMFGLTKPDETITVKPFEVFRKELVITSSFINPYTQRRALALIYSGRLDVTSMVHKIASLKELPSILGDPALCALDKYIISPEK